jgi:hypothetical protein
MSDINKIRNYTPFREEIELLESIKMEDFTKGTKRHEKLDQYYRVKSRYIFALKTEYPDDRQDRVKVFDEEIRSRLDNVDEALSYFYLTTAKHQLYCFENNILDEYDLMARENGITMIKDLIESREILYNLGRKEGRTINIPTSMLPKLFYVRLDKHGGAELL